jgi:hypothetical protein
MLRLRLLCPNNKSAVGLHLLPLAGLKPRVTLRPVLGLL